MTMIGHSFADHCEADPRPLGSLLGARALRAEGRRSTHCASLSRYRLMPRSPIVARLVMTGLFLIAPAAFPATNAGDLDPTFGLGGKVTTAMNAGGATHLGNSLAIQSDAKIVVAGTAGNGIGVVRYNTDGSLDTTFDGDGIVTTVLPAVGRSVAIQPDGKIVVAGYVTVGGGDLDVAVVRYNQDGSLDPTFGGDGIVTTAIGSSYDYGMSVAIQGDGKIVVAGDFQTLTADGYDVAVLRYDPDGSLDTTFDGDGKVTTAIGSGDDFVNAMTIQSDGKIVVAGQSGSEFAVVRYNPDGTLDTAFDGDGKVTTAVGSSALAYSVVLQGDGKIVVAGQSGSEFAVVRYNADGALDATFDGDGTATTGIGPVASGHSVAIQDNGKIVVAGTTSDVPNYLYFALVRYNANGTRDMGFGNDGKVMTAIGAAGDEAYSVALQDDGKILVAGYSANSFFPPDGNFAVARYLTGACEFTDASCQVALALKGTLLIKKNVDPTKDKIGWKWSSSGSIQKSTFGDPESGTTAFTLCVADGGGNLLFDLAAPAGGMCGGRVCWKETSTGFVYKDSLLDPDGVLGMKMKEGGIGKGKLTIKGKGANLAAPPLPPGGLTLPVRARLVRNDSAQCWESTHSTAVKNDSTQFKARSD